jgi:predicted small metal-binding protein
MPANSYRYECLETDCEAVFDAGSEDDLVEVVNKHMAEAHDTFELEDIILEGATVRQAG